MVELEDTSGSGPDEVKLIRVQIPLSTYIHGGHGVAVAR